MAGKGGSTPGLQQRVQRLLKVDAAAAQGVVRGLQAVGAKGWRRGFQADAIYRDLDVWTAVYCEVYGNALRAAGSPDDTGAPAPAAPDVVMVVMNDAAKAPLFIARARCEFTGPPPLQPPASPCGSEGESDGAPEPVSIASQGGGPRKCDAPLLFTNASEPVADRKARAIYAEIARCTAAITRHTPSLPPRPLVLRSDFRVPVTAYLLGYPCSFHGGGKGGLRDVVLYTVTHTKQRHGFSFSAPRGYAIETSTYARDKHLKIEAAAVPVTTSLVL